MTLAVVRLVSIRIDAWRCVGMRSDNEIKKALECCKNVVMHDCKNCFYHKEYNAKCVVMLAHDALDLINRLEKENNDLFLELEGVMWSVDKWLDGDELKQDKVNRAITMREKTLQITEKQQAEIERLNKNLITISNACKERRNEAIKEFARRTQGMVTIRGRQKDYFDDLLKEMTEGNE